MDIKYRIERQARYHDENVFLTADIALSKYHSKLDKFHSPPL